MRGGAARRAAFCLAVAAWLEALGHLLGGNFIRSALWLNLGIFLLFWWTDKPHDWDTMMPGVVFLHRLGRARDIRAMAQEAQGDAGHANNADVDTASRSRRQYRPDH